LEVARREHVESTVAAERLLLVVARLVARREGALLCAAVTAMRGDLGVEVRELRRKLAQEQARRQVLSEEVAQQTDAHASALARLEHAANQAQRVTRQVALRAAFAQAGKHQIQLLSKAFGRWRRAVVAVAVGNHHRQLTQHAVQGRQRAAAGYLVLAVSSVMRRRQREAIAALRKRGLCAAAVQTENVEDRAQALAASPLVAQVAQPPTPVKLCAPSPVANQAALSTPHIAQVVRPATPAKICAAPPVAQHVLSAVQPQRGCNEEEGLEWSEAAAAVLAERADRLMRFKVQLSLRQDFAVRVQPARPVQPGPEPDASGRDLEQLDLVAGRGARPESLQVMHLRLSRGASCLLEYVLGSALRARLRWGLNAILASAAAAGTVERRKR